MNIKDKIIKNKRYWVERELEQEQWIKQNIINDKEFNQLIEASYEKAADNINNLIQAKIGDRDINELEKQLTKGDYIDFIKKLKSRKTELLSLLSKDGQFGKDTINEVNARYELASLTATVNDLELLKSSIYTEITSINAENSHNLYHHLYKDYIREYKHSSDIIDLRLKHVTKKEVIANITKETKGATFSKRIWKNNDLLKNKLDYALISNRTTGESYVKTAKTLRDQVNENINNATAKTEAIVRTESARTETQATLNMMAEHDIQYGKWIAEPSACRMCMNIYTDNNGIYQVKDLPVLPAHVNCRCSITPYYMEDEDNE